ncbi:DUF2946 family protein [Parapusillimonas sp. SGNA-6]|nr:DUF2946 family protein [Parapusillimonas sp. SGNA-6]
MDEQVLAAMARWPNVPDVYGWLSLTEQGQWRLHPRGDALTPARGDATAGSSDDVPLPDTTAGVYGPGEPITSPPILHFIDRNYSHDDQGQWYFQNGPQKVYVRLDAAPYVLHTSTNPEDGLALHTHNGLGVDAVASWWLDETGRLFAMTDHGPGLVAGRDLPAVLTALRTTNGSRLLDALEGNDGGLADHAVLQVVTNDGTAPLSTCTADEIPVKLGFVRLPQPLAEDKGPNA